MNFIFIIQYSSSSEYTYLWNFLSSLKNLCNEKNINVIIHYKDLNLVKDIEAFDNDYIKIKYNKSFFLNPDEIDVSNKSKIILVNPNTIINSGFLSEIKEHDVSAKLNSNSKYINKTFSLEKFTEDEKKMNLINKDIIAISSHLFNEFYNKFLNYYSSMKNYRGKLTNNNDYLDLCCSLAINSIGSTIKLLDKSRNLSLKNSVDYPKDENLEISSILYEDLDAFGLIKKTDNKNLNSKLKIINQIIVNNRREDFDNKNFWNHRYKFYPSLGSGIGSRGEILEKKRKFLAESFEKFKNLNILDVGCGDIETVKNFQCKKYLGIDVSEESLKIAKEKRPDWNFSKKNLIDIESNSFELVICLDVLIHQSSYKNYIDLINESIRVSNNSLLISGYEEKIDSKGIVYYYEELSKSLLKNQKVSQIKKIGDYRDLKLFLVQIKNIHKT